MSKSIFAEFGMNEFTDRVADKVADKVTDKVVDGVVGKVIPVLTQIAADVKAPKSERILNRKQAADLLRVSQPTLMKMSTKGTLPRHGEGSRHIRYLESEVIAFLKNR